MYNNVNISGTVQTDVILERNEQGLEYVNCIIAVERKYKKRDDPLQFDYIKVRFLKGNARFFSSHFQRGRYIEIHGHLTTSNGDLEVIADDIYFPFPRENEDEYLDRAYIEQLHKEMEE